MKGGRIGEIDRESTAVFLKMAPYSIAENTFVSFGSELTDLFNGSV